MLGFNEAFYRHFIGAIKAYNEVVVYFVAKISCTKHMKNIRISLLVSSGDSYQ